MKAVCLILAVITGTVVALFLAAIGRLSSTPLLSESGAYDIGRATTITHLYLQVIIVLLIGLPGVVFTGWLAWRRQLS